MAQGQMSKEQQQVAAWIAVAVLAAAVIVMAILAWTSQGELYLHKTGGEVVSLSGIWGLTSYFIKAGTALHVLFGAVLAVISVAVTLVASIYTRRRDIAIISALCLLGIVFAAIALAHMSTSPQLEHLHYYGDFVGKTVEDVRGLVRAFFGAFIGWFGTFLAAILGIRIAKAREDGPAPVPAPATPGAQS